MKIMNNKINYKTLKRLGDLELRRYAGDLTTIIEEDRALYEKLLRSPIEIKMTAPKGICDDKLYEICSSVVGKHERFSIARIKLINNYAKETGELDKLCLLSMLVNGIYIGHPLDLLNYKNNKPQEIIYPIKGLGQKIAEINFL